MLSLIALFFLVTAAVPMWLAVRVNRRTSLIHAVWWAVAAWLAWSAPAFAMSLAEPVLVLQSYRYVALCLTCCAGIAVFGARQPIAPAWNFVVLGLLAVLLLPLAESWLIGTESYGWVRTLFLWASLALIFLNYLPTRLTLASMFFALGCGLEMIIQQNTSTEIPEAIALLSIALTPWIAFLSILRQPPPPSEFDKIWRSFRNRYGVVWAQRTREQFNHAAANAGWPVSLYWQGLYWRKGSFLDEPELHEQIIATLRALLKRFARQ